MALHDYSAILRCKHMLAKIFLLSSVNSLSLSLSLSLSFFLPLSSLVSSPISFLSFSLSPLSLSPAVPFPLLPLFLPFCLFFFLTPFYPSVLIFFLSFVSISSFSLVLFPLPLSVLSFISFSLSLFHSHSLRVAASNKSKLGSWIYQMYKMP